MVRERDRAGQRRSRLGAAPVLSLVLAPLLLSLGACASTERPRAIQPEYDLHDPDPTVRMQAIHAVVRARDTQQVPQLIEMLDDSDEAVRMVAIGALRDMTEFDSEYRAYAPAIERRAQVQQWRDWYASMRMASPSSLAGPETQ